MFVPEPSTVSQTTKNNLHVCFNRPAMIAKETPSHLCFLLTSKYIIKVVIYCYKLLRTTQKRGK